MRRKAKLGSKSGNKKIRNATEITVDGIKFRSKLEAYTYKGLKSAGIEFLYEEVKFNLIDPFEYKADSYESKKKRGTNIKEFIPVSRKIRAMTYLPDFVDTNKEWIIEVKGFENDSFPNKWKLFKFINKDNPFTLYKPSNQKQVDETIALILKNHNYEKNS
jgi:hypothetical protein